VLISSEIFPPGGVKLCKRRKYFPCTVIVVDVDVDVDDDEEDEDDDDDEEDGATVIDESFNKNTWTMTGLPFDFCGKRIIVDPLPKCWRISSLSFLALISLSVREVDIEVSECLRASTTSVDVKEEEEEEEEEEEDDDNEDEDMNDDVPLME